MPRCKGKLEDETRCKIIAAPGKELCTKCAETGAALYDKIAKAPAPDSHHQEKVKKKLGRPAKKGTLSEAERELQEATKPGRCTSCAGEGTCDGFGTGQTLTECAGYSPAEAASATENHSVNANEMVELDHYTAAAIALPEPDHVAAAGKLINESTEKLILQVDQAHQDAASSTLVFGSTSAEPQISPVASTPPPRAGGCSPRVRVTSCPVADGCRTAASAPPPLLFRRNFGRLPLRRFYRKGDLAGTRGAVGHLSPRRRTAEGQPCCWLSPNPTGRIRVAHFRLTSLCRPQRR